MQQIQMHKQWKTKTCFQRVKVSHSTNAGAVMTFVLLAYGLDDMYNV